MAFSSLRSNPSVGSLLNQNKDVCSVAKFCPDADDTQLLCLQHNARLAKMYAKVAGCQKAVKRSWIRRGFVVGSLCLPSAFAMVLIDG